MSDSGVKSSWVCSLCLTEWESSAPATCPSCEAPADSPRGVRSSGDGKESGLAVVAPPGEPVDSRALFLEGEEDALAPPPPLVFEGHTFSEAEKVLARQNASAFLRSLEYDVHRLWTLLLKGSLTNEEWRSLLTILRAHKANPLYPDPTWARAVPRP